MSGLSIALGLLSIPLIGAPIGEAFNALGASAVFGPGCTDDSGDKTIQAPARWRSGPTGAAGALNTRNLTAMAEFGDNRVRALHLARDIIEHTNTESCGAQLRSLPGGTITLTQSGATDIYQRRTVNVAGNAAGYRAVFRRLRHDCRVMLTIG